MSNSSGGSVADYDIGISIETKALLKKIQSVERALVNTNKKVAKSAAVRAKQEMQTEQKAAKSKEKLLDKEARAQQRTKDKEVAATKRALAKQQMQEKRFSDWKLKQFRSASFERLSLEQKMQLKRVLSARGAEESIRAEYLKTSLLMARENKRKAVAARKSRASSSRVGSSAASGAAGGGLIAGAMMNPYVLAAAATVGGGVMMANKGNDQFKELQRGATDAGMNIQDFQKEAYVNQALTGFSAEKTAQIFQDVMDKASDFTTNYEIKDGQVKGGGEFTDVVNKLINSNVVGNDKQSIDALFEGSSKEIVDRFTTLFNKAGYDQKDRAFLYESVASDLYKVMEARRDTGRVQGLEQTFNSSNIAITEQDITNITKFNEAMNGLSATFSSMPLTFFRSLTESLSPETLETMGKIGEALGKLTYILGQLLAYTLNAINPALSLLVDALNKVLDFIKPVTDAMVEMSKSFNTTFNIIKQMVSDFVKSVIDIIPSFLIPDSWKTEKPKAIQSKDVVSNTTKPVEQQAVKWDVSKPYYAQSVPTYNPYQYYTTPPPVGQTAGNSSQQNVNVKNDNSTTVVLELDGETIATKVVKTSTFKDGIGETLHPLLTN